MSFAPSKTTVISPPIAVFSSGQKVGELCQISSSGLGLRWLGPQPPQIRQKQAMQLNLSGGQKLAFTGESMGEHQGITWWNNLDALQQEQLVTRLRKSQHLDICEHHDVEADGRFTGFEEISFTPRCLPELDESQLDTSVDFLGYTARYPFFITGMTGGTQQARIINQRLAQAAAAYGIPMGVGSQRLGLESPDDAEIFRVKNFAPQLFTIGNLGIGQIHGCPDAALSKARRAVAMIDADALAIHANVVQEMVQVDGDRRFSGILGNLKHLAKHLSVPVILKEVGCGVSIQDAAALEETGIAAIDVGGRGGTSWAHIEGLRAAHQTPRQLGQIFRNWGIPTAYSLGVLSRRFPRLTLTATGGVRDGLTVAKAVALGATSVGIGLPLMRAALDSSERVEECLEGFARGLELTMMACGCQNLSQLRQQVVHGRPLEQEFRQLW